MIRQRKITMPRGAKTIIQRLNAAGFEAYAVGGCVRDSLLGQKPHDWDICTSATPNEMKHVFDGEAVYDTGIKHGTLTLSVEGSSYEVTTFRTDGSYSDNRHPDSVNFVRNLSDDLARRDFTINAMAYHDDEGVIDLFGGMSDLESGIIRCVGNANARFQEDALRVLRALRFASTYGFVIEEKTVEAVHRNAPLLNKIAAERIREELCKMLLGKGVLDILLQYSDVITTIIPELAPCVGFEQNNRYHQYTVYDHIAHAVANYKGDDVNVKVALLLHDIGKPQCYTQDERGGHFYGHAQPSRDLAEVVVNRLRFDNHSKDAVLDLVLYHDAVMEPTRKVVRRWLSKIGEERYRQLLDIRIADIQAHAENTQESRIERRNALCRILDEVVSEQQCFSLKDLAVNGRDVMQALNISQGREVGEILRCLLDKVISDELPNEYDALIAYAKESTQEQL